MAATVTIAKSYFEALLRRAELHSTDLSDFHNHTRAAPGVVTVAQAEYDYLRTAAQEYHILRNALFRGGLTPETLEILLSGNGTDEDELDNSNSWGGIFKRPAASAVTIGQSQFGQVTPDPSEPTNGNSGPLASSRTRGRSHSLADTSRTPLDQDDHEPTDRIARPVRAPSEKRTLFFSGLSEKTTHQDLANIIRGGRLLDIYIRQDRSATVAFVEGAAEFLAHARRQDYYLHQKRVEVRWADRQFNIPGHVAAKIAAGATRNIVVRGGSGKFSEDEIRNHMEHIHNLVVLDVAFRNNDVYISTNSIHNALFARTCMMSRTPYKGLRIEWYPDECAAPLPKLKQPGNAGLQARHQQQTKPPTANLYAALLDIDETDDTSDEEEGAAPIAAYDGLHLDWSDNSLLAGAA